MNHNGILLDAMFENLKIIQLVEMKATKNKYKSLRKENELFKYIILYHNKDIMKRNWILEFWVTIEDQNGF